MTAAAQAIRSSAANAALNEGPHYPSYSHSGSALMPRVPQHELQRSVDAGIMVTDRGVGEMIGLDCQVPGVSLLAKYLHANFGPASEVNLRGIARRKIVGTEQHASHGRDIGCDFARAGEVPLGDKRINSPSVLAPMDEVLVERNDVRRHLEGAAEKPTAVLVGQHATEAEADQQRLPAG